MSFEEDFKILKDLTEIQACSGNESKIREHIKDIVEKYCDKTEVDILGNLFCYLNGQKSTIKKLNFGANFIITQAGWDLLKHQELRWYLEKRGFYEPSLARILFLKPKLKVLLDAHADENGFMIRFIDKNGFLRFHQVGGQNPRILPGQIVTVHSSSGEDLIGVIGEKPIHLIQQDERKKTSKME